MAFATTDELQQLLAYDDFTPEQTTRAQLLLDLATDAIEEEAQQPLTQSQDTETLDGTGTDTVQLSRWPVSDVASVTVDGEALVADDYEWSASGLLIRASGVWPKTRRAIEVTYTAGWETPPADLKRVCLTIAARGWHNPSGASQESVGDLNRSFETRGVELSTSDRRTVQRYRP